jgi:hypothetical protein
MLQSRDAVEQMCAQASLRLGIEKQSFYQDMALFCGLLQF